MTEPGDNSAGFVPDDVRWWPGADITRLWAITRAQPLASLVCHGVVSAFTRSVPPPAAFAERKLLITAGGTHLPFSAASEAAMRALCGWRGAELAPAEPLSGVKTAYAAEVKQLSSGCLIGAARLAGAYKIARVQDGRVYADRRESTRFGAGPLAQAVGRWREFDGVPLLAFEKLEPGRWLWCFDAFHVFEPAKQLACKGYGGIWDFEAGLARRRSEAA